jgi:hypothetical protein
MEWAVMDARHLPRLYGQYDLVQPARSLHRQLNQHVAAAVSAAAG